MAEWDWWDLRLRILAESESSRATILFCPASGVSFLRFQGLALIRLYRMLYSRELEKEINQYYFTNLLINSFKTSLSEAKYFLDNKITSTP